MHSINKLPALVGVLDVNKNNKVTKTAKKNKASKKQDSTLVDQPMNITSGSISSIEKLKTWKNQVQYDSPKENIYKAIQVYLGIVNQAHKEELAQLFGVDLYI
ncbi:hypothetical protein [Candidatus Photodesmus blepharus]|uniref:hypothetical protein n=1 Tax=Candidatus Photodesmus blepharonis TaxID=1179155 RepID=UPI0005558A69|nr:hypothetical protein [Candidatus Photodesmus blepharus]